MGLLYAALLTALLVGVPILWIRYKLRGPRARMPRGFTGLVRFRSRSSGPKELADELARRLRALDAPHVVSCGLAGPPGPIRVAVEYRRDRNVSGLRFAVIVRRGKDARDAIELEVRGSSARLFGMPREASRQVLEALARALSGWVPDPQWSADGRTWRERASPDVTPGHHQG